MNASLVLVMVAIATRSPEARVRARAESIARTTSDPHEQRRLAAHDLRETGLGHRGVPFGATAFWFRLRALGETPTVDQLARASLVNVHRARHVCRDEPSAVSWYQSGACRASWYGAAVLRLDAILERAANYVDEGMTPAAAVRRARFEEDCIARRGGAPLRL